MAWPGLALCLVYLRFKWRVKVLGLFSIVGHYGMLGGHKRSILSLIALVARLIAVPAFRLVTEKSAKPSHLPDRN